MQREPLAPAPEEGGVVVLGVGNLLLSDEGVGVRVAEKLMEMDLPPGVSVIDGGSGGVGLLPVVFRAGRLIVVDAVRGGGPPGSIYRFGPEQLDRAGGLCATSVHEIGILEVLRLAELAGSSPPTTVFGIEPASTEPGMTLSPQVSARLPRLLELVIEEIGSRPRTA